MAGRQPDHSTDSKALVFPAGSVAGYGHIQSLGLAGIPVVALNPDVCDNFHSRYVCERHIVPDPTTDHEGFVQWLIDYARRQPHKPVLFMGEDVYAYIVHLYQDELAPWCLYPYIPLDRLDRFFNKQPMFEYAAHAGLGLPQTVMSPGADELADWGTFPAIIKPLIARFTFRGRKLLDTTKFPRLFGGKAIRVHDRDELLAAARNVSEADITHLVQEYLPGPNDYFCVIKYVCDEDSEIRSVFTGRKIRQHPADFGTCAVGSSEYVSEVHELSARFCKAAGWIGGGGAEFKWSDRDGRWLFIEHNPRLDFWVGMCALKGVNLPLQQYLLSTGQELLENRQRDGGRVWIDILGDRAGLKWRQARPEWRNSLREIVRPYLYFNEAVFNWKDPVPGARRLARPLIGKLLRPIRRRAGVCDVTRRNERA
jgi:predicted ATP-grasp superfamily ATP-dependent carboligase